MKDITPLEFEKPIFELKKMLDDLKTRSKEHSIDLKDEAQKLTQKLEETRREIYQNLTPWQRVQIVRHIKRPYALDYIERVFDDFVELHGDRLYGDDRAIIGGIAKFEDKPVMIVAQQKGRSTKENLMRNFGCPHPEGYRKALRLMRMAHKFKMPVFCFIDTPGAYPGVASEERHVAEAIAVNLREMFNFEVPIIALVIGEGGSGGALGIGIADRVLIMENAYYSVISPEGCASILWKDRAYASRAASALKLSAQDLKPFKFVDEIIPEPQGGAHYDWDEAAANAKPVLSRHLKEISKLSPKQLLQHRYDRFRSYGEFTE